MRRYYADRAEYLSDPDFVKISVQGSLSRAYAAGLPRYDPSGSRHAQRRTRRRRACRL